MHTILVNLWHSYATMKKMEFHEKSYGWKNLYFERLGENELKALCLFSINIDRTHKLISYEYMQIRVARCFDFQSYEIVLYLASEARFINWLLYNEYCIHIPELNYTSVVGCCCTQYLSSIDWWISLKLVFLHRLDIILTDKITFQKNSYFYILILIHQF